MAKNTPTIKELDSVTQPATTSTYGVVQEEELSAIRVIRGGGGTYGIGASAVLPFTQTDYNIGSGFTWSNSTPSRITCNFDGYVSLGVSFGFNGPVGEHRLNIEQNGGLAMSYQCNGAGFFPRIAVSNGDYLEVYFNNSGTIDNSGQHCWMVISQLTDKSIK